MSVHGMKPQFIDWAGYKAWRQEWRELYKHLSQRSVAMKHSVKHYQRVLAKYQTAGDEDGIHGSQRELSGCQREAGYNRIMLRKLMSAFNDAKIRWQSIEGARQGIEAQKAEFPIVVDDCRNIDFHFNKKSLEWPFVPMWVVKAKGKSYYVNHVDCQTPWTTRENPEHPSTKGSIRIKRGTLQINEAGDASII